MVYEGVWRMEWSSPGLASALSTDTLGLVMLVAESAEGSMRCGMDVGKDGWLSHQATVSSVRSRRKRSKEFDD